MKSNKYMELIAVYARDVFAMSFVSRSFRRALCNKEHWKDRLPELKELKEVMETEHLEIGSLLSWIEVDRWIKTLRQNPYPKSILMQLSSREACHRLERVLVPHGFIHALEQMDQTSQVYVAIAYLENSLPRSTYVCYVNDKYWIYNVIPFVSAVETIKLWAPEVSLTDHPLDQCFQDGRPRVSNVISSRFAESVLKSHYYQLLMDTK
jgi:hypothetical protein